MRDNLRARVRTALYRWAVGFTTIPMCGDDCDCRDCQLADGGYQYWCACDMCQEEDQ